MGSKKKLRIFEQKDEQQIAIYSKFPPVQKPVGCTSWCFFPVPRPGKSLPKWHKWNLSNHLLQSLLVILATTDTQNGQKIIRKKTVLKSPKKNSTRQAPVHMGPKIQLTSIMIPDTTPRFRTFGKGKSVIQPLLGGPKYKDRYYQVKIHNAIFPCKGCQSQYSTISGCHLTIGASKALSTSQICLKEYGFLVMQEQEQVLLSW